METTNLLLKPEESLRAKISVPTITNGSVQRPDYLVKSLNKFFRDLEFALENINNRATMELGGIQTAINEVAGGVEDGNELGEDQLKMARRYALLAGSH